MTELVDRRVVLGLRLLDRVTSAPVDRPMRVAATWLDPGGGQPLRALWARWMRNRGGLMVLMEIEGAEAYTTTFDLQAAGAPVLQPRSLWVDLEDPSGAYLTCRLPLSIPRDPDPAQPNNVLTPVDAHLFRGPAMGARASWGVVYAHVRRSGSDTPLPGALLRLQWGVPVRTAYGLTDARGEAVILVPGIPVTTWGANETSDEVFQQDFPATLSAAVDPDSLDEALEKLTRPPRPTDLLDRFDALPHTDSVLLVDGSDQPLTLRSGQSRTALLEIDLA